MKNHIMSTLLLAVLFLTSFTVSADDKVNAEGHVDKSLATLVNFADDPEMKWFRQHIENAKGILIFPTQVKAGFLIGGSGGSGVLLRHGDDNQWSYPAFYGMGSVTAGFQAGVQHAEVVMLLMTDKAMDAMLSTKVQLGTDVSVALGPVGAGTAVHTADIYQFSRAKGVFGGLTIEGAVISPRDKLNEAYYGKVVSPKDILVLGLGTNRQADPLRDKLASFKDSDGDGVTDFYDKCPNTLQGTKVDRDGCWAYHGAVFDSASADIKPESKAMFDNALEVLKSNPNVTVEIQGYADSSGNADFNLKLSERRAQSVKDYLVANGIDPSRLTVKGYGIANPVASNDTATGRAYNRRVTFEIISR